MSSTPSASDPSRPGAGATPADDPPSSAYQTFHPLVQKWVYTSGWRRLRDAQERAAAPVLAGDRDVIIAAGTASGKTEAALLPICTALLRAADRGERVPGVDVLYVSPLKALINDQYDRIRRLGEPMDIPVHRWHGDVASSRKSRVMRMPDGILLITPESLEAMFVNHGHRIPGVFRALRYVVVDELHCFLGTERGAQLRSLLHRLELAVRRRVPRIALSATLGDLAGAAEYLRAGSGDGVVTISSAASTGEIRLQVRGYVAAGLGAGLLREPASPDGGPAAGPVGGGPVGGGAGRDAPGTGDNLETHHLVPIADHLFRTMRTNDNLVFVNSRAAVETYTDMLNRRKQAAMVRTEFLAHHGSLSKEIREQVEERLKDPTIPVTAVCTSTLELGIDVGSVDSIAQIGSPLTVSSLRQRLGRSGRRPGQPAVLRLYVSEAELTDHTPPPDALRDELFQTVAMVELLLDGWYERPDRAGLHLSTLIQQVLSLLAQHGGVRVATAYTTLCGRGPFSCIDRATFLTLLRDLGRHGLIRQDGEGTLLPDDGGERLLGHYSFYAAFHTSADYRLVAAGRTLGSLPVDRPMPPGTLIIFNGRRWRVISVTNAQRVIELEPASSGQPPAFPGVGGEVADEVRQTMFELYRGTAVPRYLDATARDLFAEGRASFHRFGHTERRVFGSEDGTLLFPWRGDRIMNTLLVALTHRGLEVGQDGLCLTVRDTGPNKVLDLIDELAAGPPPDPLDLARTVRVKTRDKYDRYLGDDLLTRAYAARALDLPGTWNALAELAAAARPR
jgi:ATP-dependent Lhr-like helicase